MIFLLFVNVIVPLSISRVVNVGREDLFAFVKNQGREAQASFRRIWTIVSLVLMGVATLLLFLFAFQDWLYSYVYSLGSARFDQIKSGTKVVWLLVGTLIVIVAAVVQCILFFQSKCGPLCRICRQVAW